MTTPAPNSQQRPTLYLLGVPLGDPLDISVRGLRLLAEADILFCEDRKTTARLMAVHKIPFPEDRWFPINEHTTERELGEYLTEVLRAKVSVLVSDAGLPVLADPGAELVSRVREQGGLVRVVPGPTAATIALVSAGWGNHAYHFLGFAPRKAEERARFLRGLGVYSDPVVLYETPYRLSALLEEMHAQLPPETKIFLGIELTSPREYTRVLRVREIPEILEHLPKGPPCLVIAPPEGGKHKKA